jgi:ribosomal protein S18 acetylase RimI-like enzyme
METAGAGTEHGATRDWVIERGDPAAIDRLEPLWKSLLAHHRDVYAGLPLRSPDDSWRRRRAQYERWLATEDSFFVVARRGEALLGYAMVELCEGSPMWDTGERAAELQTLIVLPGERRLHLGSALMDAVDRELERLGERHVLVEIMADNDEAVRFYEGRGYKLYTSVLHRGHGPGETEDDGDG